MGKITVHEFVSLDGVFENPSWTADFGFTEGMGQALAALTAAARRSCSAARTFEMFAPAWSTRSVDDDPGVPFFNDTPKYVVSSTLSSADAWQNSTVLGGYDAAGHPEAQGRHGRRHLHQRQRHAGTRAAGRRPGRRAAPARLPGRARGRSRLFPDGAAADVADPGGARGVRERRAAPDLRARRRLTPSPPAPGAGRATPPCEAACDGRMTGWQMVAVAAAGFAAGGINAVVGSGTLVTFPVLLAVGLPPVTATVSNSLGLVPGNLTGAIGYRRELAGQRGLLLRLLPASVLGALTGAFLLLHLPASSFEAIVPVLIGLAVVLVAVQPAIAKALRTRRPADDDAEQHVGPGRMAALFAGAYATGTYGGYFAASQGVLQIGIFGLLLRESLQRLNAIKNVLTTAVNGVAAARLCRGRERPGRLAGLRR